MFTFTRLLALVYVVSSGTDSHLQLHQVGVLPASKVTINRAAQANASIALAPTSERLNSCMPMRRDLNWIGSRPALPASRPWPAVL